MSKMMTIQDIAGFCPESAVWKMMADVSDFILQGGCGFLLKPDTIAVEGEQFLVTNTKNDATKEEMVWALGAVAYYAATGHDVFGGHGWGYQQEHPQVALPVLPKSFRKLTPVIHGCLCYDVSRRIKMEELRQLAQKGLVACAQQIRTKTNDVEESRIRIKGIIEIWPEEMIV